MSIIYQGIFAVLMAEMALCIFLIAPLPLTWRAKAMKMLVKSKIVRQIRSASTVIFIIIVALFFDSMNRSYKKIDRNDQRHDRSNGGDSNSYFFSKLFQAQRNMYLTASVLFMALILNRFHAMIFELVKNEEKTEQLKQKAAKTTKDYLKLLDKDQKNSSSGDGLKKQLEDKIAECKKLTQDLEIVKKQAEQSHDAFLKLTDEFNSGPGSKKDD